ncbi:MAG: methylhydantoinase, partial [Spirochaetae bacterium HGW-Spirochaetae-6]
KDFLKGQVDQYLALINDRPIYTVNEFFQKKIFCPRRIFLVGGGAPYFKSVMEEAFGIPVLIPEVAGYCNALGAALSKVTAEVNLFANTADGKCSIPELNYYQPVVRNFSLSDAKELSLTKLQELLEQKGIDLNERLEVTEAQSFNMVRGFSSVGKSIRVKAQVKPGLMEQKY